MTFKFERLDVWQLALEYIDLMYELAESSTGQSDAEQNRFLGIAVRSLIETVACQRIIKRRNYISDAYIFDKADKQAQSLAKRLHAFRKALSPSGIREESTPYEIDEP